MRFPEMDILYLVIIATILASHGSVYAVSRSFQLSNKRLTLECGGNKTMVIQAVTLLGRNNQCALQLGPYDGDFRQIMDSCNGKKECKNIYLSTANITLPCSGVSEVSEVKVDYKCIEDDLMNDICFERTESRSPYVGYLTSPGYSVESGGRQPLYRDGTTCQCEITARSGSQGRQVPRIMMRLIDVDANNQMNISFSNGTTQTLCHFDTVSASLSASTKCILEGMNFTLLGAQSFKVEYRPSNTKPKMFLSYSAINLANSNATLRMTTVCKRIEPVINEASTTQPLGQIISRSDTTKNPNSINKELLEETLRLEFILAIAIAAVVLCLTVIIVIVCCIRRKSSSSGSSTSSGPIRFILTPSTGKHLYDQVPDVGQYPSIPFYARQTTGESHVYHEPASDFKSQSDQPKTEGDERIYYRPCSEAGNSVHDPIYESVQNIDELGGSHTQGCSRHSRMTKYSSIPQSPAPPVPIGLVRKLSNQTPLSANPSQTPSMDDSHYITPATQKTDASANSQRSSMGSMPSLELDFSEFLKETDMRFDASKLRFDNNEYMQPIDIMPTRCSDPEIA